MRARQTSVSYSTTLFALIALPGPPSVGALRLFGIRAFEVPENEVYGFDANFQ
jgi:hypothetical protein